VKSMFNIGDEVKIRKDSVYYRDGPGNPTDTVGKVVGHYTQNIYIAYVRWPDGRGNSYRECDLEKPEKTLLEI